MKVPMIKKEEGCKVITMRIYDRSKTLFEKCRCGAGFGDRHKIMCDTERCAHCGGQYITCGCATDEDAMERIPWLGM